MSIPFLDRILDNWHNQDYEGFSELLPRTNFILKTVDYELLDKMKLDIEQVQYLEPALKPIDSYPKTKEGLFQFLSDRNFKTAHPRDQIKAYKITGGDNQADIEVLKRFLNMDMEYVLQIAFGSGAIVMDILENTKAYVITHSLYRFEHSWYGKIFIDYNFPNRHVFHMGMSTETVKSSWFSTPDIKYDFILYSGSRQHMDVYNLIKECKQWSHPGTIIYLTAVVPHQGWGYGPYVAMNHLLKDGIVYFVEHIKTPGFYGDFTNGIAILKYNFDDNMTPPSDSSSPIYNKNLYKKLPLKMMKDIEIEIPLYELSYYIRNAKDKDARLPIDMVIYYLKRFIKEGVPLDKWILGDLKQLYGITVEDGKVIEGPIPASSS